MANDRVGRDYEDLVRLYLADIGQYTLLTKHDEVRLAKAIEAGKEAIEALNAGGEEITAPGGRELRRTVRRGEEAERQFVQCNLRLVVSIAKKYQALGLPLLDLIQEGNLGSDARRREVRLAQGVQVLDVRDMVDPPGDQPWHRQQRSHDPPPGQRRRHARPPAKGPVAPGSEVRPPGYAGRARPRGRDAARTRWREALRFAAEPLSLSEKLREEGDAELGDVVEDRSAQSPFEVAATALLPVAVARLLAPLDEREREILKLRFGLDRGEPRTLQQVGVHFNLTSERIRQIEAQGDEQAAPSVERHGRPRPPRRVVAEMRPRRLSADEPCLPHIERLTLVGFLAASAVMSDQQAALRDWALTGWCRGRPFVTQAQRGCDVLKILDVRSWRDRRPGRR